jgi:quinol monooxygenase YgiN
MGLWKDTGDRAMPIKMNVNPGNSNQVKEALESLIKEMREKNSTTGFIAAQSYN